MSSSASGFTYDNFLRIEKKPLVTTPPSFSHIVRAKLFVSKLPVTALEIIQVRIKSPFTKLGLAADMCWYSRDPRGPLESRMMACLGSA